MSSSVAVGELNLDVVANIDPLVSGLDEASSSMNRFRKDAQRLAQQVMTPQQRHYDNMTKSQVLYNKGLITSIQAIRAQQMSVRDMNATLGKAANGTEKSSNRMSFAIGQALTGVEDFATVVGTTGLAGGLRAASNNFAQAGRIMLGEFAGPMIGIGSIIAAVVLPKIIEFASGAENAAAQTKRWKEETDALRDSLQRVVDVQSNKKQQQRDARDISRITSTDEVDRRLEQENDLLKDTRDKMQNARRAAEVEAQHIMDQVFTQSTRDGVERMIAELHSNGMPKIAEIASKALADAENDFLFALTHGSTEDAIKNFQDRIQREFGNSATRIPGLTGEFSNIMQRGVKSGAEGFLGNPEMLQEAANSMDKIQKTILDNRKEVENIDQRQIKLLEQRKQTLKAELAERQRLTREDVEQNEMSIKAEIARAKEMSMLADMTEAEKALFQIQKDRIALLEKGAELGAAGTEEARAISNAILRSRAAVIEAELRSPQPMSTFSTGQAGSIGAARAAAIRSIAQQASQGGTEDQKQRQKMVDELKGIKQILAGQKPVELSPVQ